MNPFSGQKSTLGASTISWLPVLAYLFVIIGIEVSLLLGVNPGWGTLFYGLMLISLLVLAALIPEISLLLIGLSGVPIMRIVAYGIPISSSNPTIPFGVTGLALLFYIIPTMRMPELAAFRILRPPQKWPIQVAIILSGAIVGFCQFLVYPQKVLYFNSLLEHIAFIATLALSAFAEEVVFRGIVLTGFTSRFTQGMSVILASLVYASLFIPFGSLGLGLVMFLTSLVYGFAAVKSSGLYGVIGAHFVSSIIYYLMLPIK